MGDREEKFRTKKLAACARAPNWKQKQKQKRKPVMKSMLLHNQRPTSQSL